VIDKDWKKLRFFRPSDVFAPDKIDFTLMYKLDQLRIFINKPIIITSSNDPGQVHENNSYHYKGLAVDIVVPQADNMMDVYLAATRFNWGGIGIYPDWKYDGKTVGGMHLDVRPVDASGHNASWMGVGSPQQYVAFNKTNLKLYGVI
jgi:uncharacterized protein YcbK (DUF882 family)